MRKQFILFSIFILINAINLYSQDTLPNFSLKNAGKNRIIIGWTNNFENIRQLSIQRSFDSLTGYKTILTVPDPTTTQNGYLDAKATNDHMFYRLYIMLDKGSYLFSKVKKPIIDSFYRLDPITKKLLPNDTVKGVNPIVINIGQFPGTDSVSVPNKVNPKNNPNAFTPSLFVYTNKDGYVRISLPNDEKTKKYSIKFFDADNTFLFELKEIKEKDFKLDKTDFYHAGWFKFELYEDGKLKEKHKFYLEKDF